MKQVVRTILGWNYLVVLVYLAVALFILRDGLTGSSFGLQYDWSYPLLTYDRLLDGVRYIWSAENNGIIPLYRTNAITDGIIGAIGTITHISPQVLYKLVLVTLFTSSGVSMYALMRGRQYSRLVAFLTGLFYLTSTVLMTRAITGYFGYLVSMAAFPFLMYLYYQACKASGVAQVRVILGMAVVSCFAFYQVHFAVFFVWFVMADAIIHLILLRRITSGVLAGVGTLIGYALCNLFWVFPILQNMFVSDSVVSNLANQVALNSRSGSLPNSIWETIIMQSHAVTAPILYPMHSNLSDRLVLLTVLLLLLVGAALNKKRRAQVAVFAVLVIATLPIALGPDSPLGAVYKQLLSALPVLKMFREPYHLAFLMLLFWTTVLGAAVEWCLSHKRTIQRPRLHFAVGAIAVGMIVLVNMPSLMGTYFGYFGSVDLPNGLASTNNRISELTAGRVYYPPNLNFWKLTNDVRTGVNYPDQIGLSMDRIPVTGASSDLEVRNSAWRLRNAVTSSLLHRESAFPQLLGFLGADLAVYRPYLQNHYPVSVGLNSTYTKEAARWVGRDYQADLQSFQQLEEGMLTDGSTAYQVEKRVSPVTAVHSLASVCSLSDIPASADAFVYRPVPEVAEFAADLCVDRIEAEIRNGQQGLNLAAVTDLKHAPIYGWTPGDLAFYIDPLLPKILTTFLVTQKSDSLEIPVVSGRDGAAMTAYYMAWPKGGELKIGEQIVSTVSPKAEWREISIAPSQFLRIESISGENLFQGAVLDQSNVVTAVPQKPLSKSVVSSSRVSPVKTTGELYNPSRDHTIVAFSENYNPNWRLTINGVSYAPVELNGWQNAFVLPAEAAGTYSIEFGQQRQYGVLLWVSGVLLLAFLVIANFTLVSRISHLYRKP